MTLPLTDYITALMRQPREKLARINPDKAAAHYGIRPDVAEYYLRQEHMRRRAAR